MSHFDPTIRDARCRFRKVVLDGWKRFAFSKSWHLTNRDNHDDFGVSLNKSFVAQVLSENLPMNIQDARAKQNSNQTRDVFGELRVLNDASLMSNSNVSEGSQHRNRDVDVITICHRKCQSFWCVSLCRFTFCSFKGCTLRVISHIHH